MTSFGLGQAPINEDPIEPSTPWLAASDGNLSLLQTAMTKLNLQATAADENGYTLLHAAAAYNQRSVMEFLLQQQSNPNAQDNEGDTPLHHVDQVEAAKFLIEVAGANPKITNTESKTALQAKQDELRDQMEDDEDDGEDLKNLVNYLQTR